MLTVKKSNGFGQERVASSQSRDETVSVIDDGVGCVEKPERVGLRGYMRLRKGHEPKRRKRRRAQNRG